MINKILEMRSEYLRLDALSPPTLDELRDLGAHCIECLLVGDVRAMEDIEKILGRISYDPLSKSACKWVAKLK